MKQSKRISITASTDSMGSLYLTPKVRRFARAYRAAVVANGGPNELSVFAQEGSQLRTDLLECIPARKVNELESGYDVTFLADPWDVGHWYGYDAAETVELPWGR